ncbi:CaiB/BaiF CoA-transferase family protein [Bordetella sp. 15P40C-2]|uniref:CaiB/BaiF CoA transferase family protein n=1 Tax=Bordetella sp. 15P40C-2 TaxID=2572246 RepID=UPI0013294093|nr:CoA transferase [Bordetella sp. 15P40C-2]MVW70749.1 CoA transferase [Bordetella sp. 15P40C-2]
MSEQHDRLSLSGVRVLDLTRVRAGPTAVRVLADWGADVVKIEEPVDPEHENEMGGMRLGPDYQNLHRNKRSVTLNLKSEKGRALLLELAANADVLVENYRPDVKQRLGIDYETLRERNPRLIYASISGFGQDGPYARRPGYDQIIQGMSGMMSVTGLPGQGPVRAGIAIADTTAGLYGALGILTALYEREKTGHGQWVRTSLLESMLATMDFQCARYLVAGEVPKQVGNDHPTIIPTGVFDTLDGKVNICVSGTVMWKRFCMAMGRESWLSDPRFATNKARSANRHELNAEIAQIFATQTNGYWIEHLNASGLACGAVNNVQEAFEDEQVQHLGIAWPAKHEKLGDIRLVGQPFRIGDHQPGVRRVAPMPGEDNASILAEIGIEGEALQQLRNEHVI